MKVVVVGGGLVGGVAALALADMGFQVTVVEKQKAITMDGNGDANTRRSINLALSHRGQEALKRVGLYKEAMDIAVPMFSRAIHDKTDGSVTLQPYDEIDSTNYINSISRSGLNFLLMDKASKHPNVEIVYGYQLTNIDKQGTLHFTESGTGTFNDCSPGSFQLNRPELVIGADGAYSGVREAMLRLQTTNFKREYISHGYKELDLLPDEKTGDFRLAPVNALHIWPRGDFMMIALPNPDKTFTCTLFAPMDELEQLSQDGEIHDYFMLHFPDLIPLMPDYIQQFKQNPACRLVMSQVDPWRYQNIILVGDAAHAQVPFFGQGMNAGMEDVLELCELIEEFPDSALDLALAKYDRQRKPRGNAIITLSLNNYIEMRSHTASRLFLFRKKVEGVLNWLFPETWVPLYKMVAFTRIPYDQVIERAQAQDKILHRVSTALILGAIGTCLGIAGSLFTLNNNRKKI